MIRWPVDALYFREVRATHALYGAGFVDDGQSPADLIGAVPNPAGGLTLVAFHPTAHAHDGAAEDLRALKVFLSHQAPSLVPMHDVRNGTVAMSFTRRQLTAGLDVFTAIEELPGCVHVPDLRRALGRLDGDLPEGFALYVLASVIKALRAAATRLGAVPHMCLDQRDEHVLIGWDGVVRMKPRVVLNDPSLFLGHSALLLRGLTNRAEWPPVIQNVVNSVGTLTLDALAEAVDVARASLEPFDAPELAGLLAQLFPRERAEDLEMREELSTLDLATAKERTTWNSYPE